MVGDCTEATWSDFVKVLERIPEAHRDDSWKRVKSVIEEILRSPNSLAVPVVPSELRYAPECALCHNAIAIDDDFVFKAISAKYVHYDCNFRDHPENLV